MPATLRHSTVLAGVNNPAYAFSKDAGNADHVLGGFGAKGAIPFGDATKATGIDFVEAVAVGSAMVSKGAATAPGWQQKAVIDVRDFGAEGNADVSGTVDDTSALQAAFDAVPRYSDRAAAYYDIGGAVVFPPGRVFRISAPLTAAVRHMRIIFNGSMLYNVGVGTSALIVAENEISLEHLFVKGQPASGGWNNFGTTGHGIELDGAAFVHLTNVISETHGGHGLYLHGGSWSTYISGGRYSSNGLDGIHALSTSGAPTDQNGNNLSVDDVILSANGFNGLLWNGVGLTVKGGCEIDSNGQVDPTGAGILLTCYGTTHQASGAIIAGNYFEDNIGGCLRFRSLGSGYVVTGVEVLGNSFTVGNVTTAGAATALICAPYTAGDSYSLHVHIGTNSYGIGGNVTHWVDMDNMLMDSSVDGSPPDAAMFVNLGTQRVAFSHGHMPAIPAALSDSATVADVVAWLKAQKYAV